LALGEDGGGEGGGEKGREGAGDGGGSRGWGGEYGAEVVGASLSVIWVHYGCYFAGVVRSFDARSGTHHVVYDDGDEEDIVLRAADVMWGGGRGGGGNGGGGGDGGGNAGEGGGGRRSGDGRGGGKGGDGVTAAGEVARQERTHTSMFRGETWERVNQRWRVQFMQNYKTMRLGYFDEEEDAARVYDRMRVWFSLHGIARRKPGGGGVYDSSGINDSLNFAYDDYKDEFDELKRMTEEECVHKLKQQGGDKRKRKRPESATGMHMELVGAGRCGSGDGDGGCGGSDGAKRTCVRSELATDKQLAPVGVGGGGVCGGGKEGGNSGGVWGGGVVEDAQHAAAAVRALASVT